MRFSPGRLILNAFHSVVTALNNVDKKPLVVLGLILSGQATAAALATQSHRADEDNVLTAEQQAILDTFTPAEKVACEKYAEAEGACRILTMHGESKDPQFTTLPPALLAQLQVKLAADCDQAEERLNSVPPSKRQDCQALILSKIGITSTIEAGIVTRQGVEIPQTRMTLGAGH